MPSQLDARLAALAAADIPSAPESALAGLEDSVWTRVQARKAAAAAGGAHVRVTVTVAALGIGLAIGVLHQQAQRPVQGQAQVQAQVQATSPEARVAELGVLSEDGLLAPSVRLGGGA